MPPTTKSHTRIASTLSRKWIFKWILACHHFPFGSRLFCTRSSTLCKTNVLQDGKEIPHLLHNGFTDEAISKSIILESHTRAFDTRQRKL